jgi:hypothetical protein
LVAVKLRLIGSDADERLVIERLAIISGIRRLEASPSPPRRPGAEGVANPTAN